MQFRTEPEDIIALYNLAAKRNQPISTMIREWVLERLEQEQGNSPVKLDITLNKKKVGSVALASAVLSIIDKNSKTMPVRDKEKSRKLFEKALIEGNKRYAGAMKKQASK